MNNKSKLDRFEEYVNNKGESAVIYREANLAVLNVGHDSIKATFFFLFDELNNNVQILARDFINIPIRKSDLCEKLVNKYNRKYRWIKLEWDENENNIFAEYDMELRGDDDAEHIFEIMGKLFNAIIDICPEMVRDVWESETTSLNKTLDEVLRRSFANAE